MDTLSLSLALALTLAPVKKTTLERTPVVAPPAPSSLVVVAVADVKPPESLTTCYANKNGCWSE